MTDEPTETIEFDISDEELEQLEAMAKEQGISTNQLIVNILEEMIKEEGLDLEVIKAEDCDLEKTIEEREQQSPGFKDKVADARERRKKQ